MWPASLKRGKTRVSKSYDRFWKGFGVGVNWLRKWCEIVQPITKRRN